MAEKKSLGTRIGLKSSAKAANAPKKNQPGELLYKTTPEKLQQSIAPWKQNMKE